MDNLIETATGLGILLALTPFAVMAVRSVKRSSTSAAMAGMLLLLSPFIKVEPPPPARAESFAREDEDEPGAGAPPQT